MRVILSQNERMQPTINLINTYKLHLVLVLITGFLWLPFYLYLCFIELNNLAKYPAPKNVPSTKNNSFINLLFAVSFFGLPLVLYRKYHLLHEYLKAQVIHLKNITFQEKEKEKEEKESGERMPIRVNVIEAKIFVGFAIADFFLFALATSTIFLGSYYYRLMAVTGSTGSSLLDTGAYMILFVIGIPAFVSWIAFTVRIIQEELKWHHALATVVSELKKLERK